MFVMPSAVQLLKVVVVVVVVIVLEVGFMFSFSAAMASLSRAAEAGCGGLVAVRDLEAAAAAVEATDEAVEVSPPSLSSSERALGMGITLRRL